MTGSAVDVYVINTETNEIVNQFTAALYTKKDRDELENHPLSLPHEMYVKARRNKIFKYCYLEKPPYWKVLKNNELPSILQMLLVL